MGKTCFCLYKRLPHSEILLPTFPQWQWATVCKGSLCLQRAPVQTQMVQALLQVSGFAAWMISSSTLAGQACAAAAVQRLIYPRAISRGDTSGVSGNDCPEHLGQSSLCSAASALGQAWKRIRWLQGKKFWHPGVLLPSWLFHAFY